MNDTGNATFENARHRQDCDSCDPAGEQRTLSSLRQQLATFSFASNDVGSRGVALKTLCAQGLDRLPMPGRGHTVVRWAALGAVAACDLALVKLYEGHTDALAILAELNRRDLVLPGQRWGVWAAEHPQRRVEASRVDESTLRLEGQKAWCSGAATLTHALVTAWHDGKPILAAVELAGPSISISADDWQAVGMAATGTADVCFDGARAVQVGGLDAYLSRPGFWHGGAGIAACWYGCAAGLAAVLRKGVQRHGDPHALAYLGAADMQLAATGALLRETAAWIDRFPRAGGMRHALRARLAVEHAAIEVIGHATRALGAGPLCSERKFACAVADLPIFLRQNHAGRDEAGLGQSLIDEPDITWQLDDT